VSFREARIQRNRPLGSVARILVVLRRSPQCLENRQIRAGISQSCPRQGVAAMSLPPGAGSNPIAVLSDGRIFSIDLYGMLYSVDPATGASKVLGPTGIPVPDYTDPQFTFSNGFTSVGNQLYYLWGGGDSKRNIPVHLYRIDPETYLTYDVGPTGIDAIGSLGTAQGRLFGCVFAPDTFVPLAIAEVDLLTGKATVYSSLPGQEFILAISDTPEPTPGSQRPPLTGLDISSPHRLAHRMSPR
jgi:hypothetical protein